MDQAVCAVPRQTASARDGGRRGGSFPERLGGAAQRVGGHAKPSLGGFAVFIQGGARNSIALAGRGGAGETATAFADGVDGAGDRGTVGADGRDVGAGGAVVVRDRDAAAGGAAPAGEGCGF